MIKPEWVHEAWEQRDVEKFSPINTDFTRPHKLKAFEGHKICFLGFATEEHDHMIDVLNRNGGIHTAIEDPECTHVVSVLILNRHIYRWALWFLHRLLMVKVAFIYVFLGIENFVLNIQ